LAYRRFERVIVTGLCGLLVPAFAVGEALVYCEIVTSNSDRFAFDRDWSRTVAERAAGPLSGVRAFAADEIVTHASQKRLLAQRYGVQAADMETLAVSIGLHAAGVEVAALRVGSDAAADDLPELNRTLDGSGGLDAFALALAMVRRPLAGARLALNGTRALGALERAVYVLLTAGA